MLVLKKNTNWNTQVTIHTYKLIVYTSVLQLLFQDYTHQNALAHRLFSSYYFLLFVCPKVHGNICNRAVVSFGVVHFCEHKLQLSLLFLNVWQK
jgi:hypothetical protein